MTNINLLKIIWSSVYSPELNTVKQIEKFFHEDYEQYINGQWMRCEEYIKHVLAQKQNIKISNIESDDELFALYYPKGTNVQKQIIDAEVIAYIKFCNQQIISIHGQVRLIEGGWADIDMSDH